MMRPAAQRHIDAMKIVMARGCTMLEALAKVDATNARLRWSASMAVLEKVKAGGSSAAPAPETKRREFWWERD